MRAADIDRTKDVWEYRPPRFKTEHHNEDDVPDRDRLIFIGPVCQLILAPYLAGNPASYLFAPTTAESLRNASRRLARKSPMTPSQAARTAKGRRISPLKPHYSVASYRQAINRACAKASIPKWSPNQLRHLRLTEIRKCFGLEASRVCGGHREIGVTQMYAEQDHDLARDVMAKIG
ncbi:site-specific integrase [Zavarzinella formosa]|uniref:hypothetical protein n=1 Tax=Zavarzinella formosa TaxID=360055 RepID=UPI0012FC383A|nr:hypothetical protein [Zavarzinella formosa]